MRLWLSCYSVNLAEEAQADPFVSSLLSTHEGKLSFLRAFLEKHAIAYDEEDCRGCLEAAAGQL